jgi:hypothetical protein
LADDRRTEHVPHRRPEGTPELFVAEGVAVVLQPDELRVDGVRAGELAIGQSEVQRPQRWDDEEDADHHCRWGDERDRPARTEEVAAGAPAPAAIRRGD